MARPTLADLQAALDALLAASGGLSLAGGGAADDGYEAVLWSIVVSEMRRSFGPPEYLDPGEKPAAVLRFRRSPSPLQSKSQPWAHARFRTGPDADDLEVHVGVQVRGRSGVRHECDVAVVTRSPARAAVATGTDLYGEHVVFAVEGKFLSAGSLPLGYARALMGLRAEVSRQGMYALASTRPHGEAHYVLRTHRLASVGQLSLDAAGLITGDRALRTAARKAISRYLSDPWRYL